MSNLTLNSNVNSLEYDKIKDNLKQFFKAQDEFKDYTKIHSGEYSFCQQCSKQTKKLINDLGIATNGWI